MEGYPLQCFLEPTKASDPYEFEALEEVAYLLTDQHTSFSNEFEFQENDDDRPKLNDSDFQRRYAH